MEITVGKQALDMRGRRKWVKVTKIGCGQKLVALWRGGKISVPQSQNIWCHGSTANFTTPPHKNNTTPHITWWIINCDFKRWKQIFISSSLTVEMGGITSTPQFLSFHFVSKQSHYFLQNYLETIQISVSPLLSFIQATIFSCLGHYLRLLLYLASS